LDEPADAPGTLLAHVLLSTDTGGYETMKYATYMGSIVGLAVTMGGCSAATEVSALSTDSAVNAGLGTLTELLSRCDSSLSEASIANAKSAELDSIALRILASAKIVKNGKKVEATSSEEARSALGAVESCFYGSALQTRLEATKNLALARNFVTIVVNISALVSDLGTVSISRLGRELSKPALLEIMQCRAGVRSAYASERTNLKAVYDAKPTDAAYAKVQVVEAKIDAGLDRCLSSSSG
jgi:hypothetical protein